MWKYKVNFSLINLFSFTGEKQVYLHNLKKQNKNQSKNKNNKKTTKPRTNGTNPEMLESYFLFFQYKNWVLYLLWFETEKG